MIKFDFAGDKPEGYYVKAPEWKLIPETEKYMVSRKGDILRLPFQQKTRWPGTTVYKGMRLLNNCPGGNGYYHFNATINGETKTRLIHRYVAQAFIPNPENKLQVNHKNGIKTDNRVENLEWVTDLENKQHAIDTGLINHDHYLAASFRYRKKKDFYPYHQFKGPRKLTDDDVRYIRANGDKMTYVEIAKVIGCTRKTVANCYNGRFYQDVK